MRIKSSTLVKKHEQEDILGRLLDRAVEHIYPSRDLLHSWLTSRSKRKLNVYQGFDPTADTLHIGHTVGMRKLRDFQKLGHNVTFLIGDFTGRIGDPTDKTAARKKLTKEQVSTNLKNFKDQASRILDFDDTKNPVHVKFNSKWLAKVTFEDLIEYTSHFTVQQMIKRDMFQKRIKEDHPIYLHEFLYPVMQSIDSVVMDIDVEVGGNDQTFNMLCGRDLTESTLHKQKVVLACKLLVDPQGAKMGKSEGNMIMLSDSPEDMYGKVMAFPDTLIIPGFEILTDLPMEKVENMQKEIYKGTVNPMDLKKTLAFLITSEHKGEDKAHKAQTHFESVFQKRDSSSDRINTIKVKAVKLSIIDILVKHAQFSRSNSQAKRLVEQGGVTIDGVKIFDKNAIIQIVLKGITIRAGKQIARIVSQ